MDKFLRSLNRITIPESQNSHCFADYTDTRGAQRDYLLGDYELKIGLNLSLEGQGIPIFESQAFQIRKF